MSEQKVIQGDCLEVMQSFGDESFDVICTDPPYNLDYNGRSLDYTGKRTHSTFANDSLGGKEYVQFVARVTREMARVAKKDSAMYVFIDWRSYPVWAENVSNYYGHVKNCIVWDKGSFGLGNFYRYQHEFCIFAVRGEYKLNRHGLSDVWHEKRENVQEYQHPTQKPVSIIQKILVDTPKDARILDPFMGSGTTLMAAKLVGRDAVGIELSPEYCSTAEARLSQGMLFSGNVLAEKGK